MTWEVGEAVQLLFIELDGEEIVENWQDGTYAGLSEDGNHLIQIGSETFAIVPADEARIRTPE